MAFAYLVRCTFDDRSVRSRFATWLVGTHIADVCRSGAEDAELVVVDDPCAVEVRYRFTSRAAFERYERDHAQDRRAEGIAELARLGVAVGEGVTFARWTGEIVPLA